MQQAEMAEDNLSQQLSAWEAEGDHQLAMGSEVEIAPIGSLSYDAPAFSGLRTAMSFSPHACHPTNPFHDSSVSDNSDKIHQTTNNNTDLFAANSGLPQEHYEAMALASYQGDVSTTKEATEKDQADETITPAGNNIFPSPGDGGVSPDVKDSVSAAVVNSVKGEAITGPRVAFNQGVRRLLDRAHSTRCAMRRGVQRVREMVGLIYRNARYNNAITGRDKEVCEPLLEDDAYTEQDDWQKISQRVSQSR